MTERLTRKRGPGLPPLPDWLRFPVPSAAGVLCAGRIAVLIADDDGPDALGLSLAARLVCAHPRVRRRFRGRTWWLPIGERPPGRTATRAALQHRDDLLGGRPLGFTGDWWSEQSQAILAGYRRLLHDPDPEVHRKAAQDWCAWESVTPDWPPATGIASMTP